ncbi:hypothetical protein GCM10027034_02130 [Ramlibacter solisilvae]|uniref:DUF4214 domain-containing protein n=1 Tax=Ramlibacter tataouinensis TaxID=94132 RepID=A0A127JUJ3_9BURK|nr:DUF4214 domain-containing protein [Ramlibacter tataouinensis]AMO21682.1 hypothetical protein UC35_00845 [Ramlibacter tataouinensis]
MFVQTSPTTPTGVQLDFDAPPVTIFQGAGGVNVRVHDYYTVRPTGDGHIDRVIVGTSGDDRIIDAGGKDTLFVLGTGHDTVVLSGYDDDMVVAGLGDAIIDGGLGGRAGVQLTGSASDYEVIVSESSGWGGTPRSHVTFINTTTHATTNITNVKYVQFDGGGEMIFAGSAPEAAVAALYHAAFGRSGEHGGIEYWFDKLKDGLTLQQIAVGFTISPEFRTSAASSASNFDFVNGLYHNTFDRAPDTGGLAYWLDRLDHGATRADLLAAFANVAGMNEDGTLHTEPTIVGNVTIVDWIVEPSQGWFSQGNWWA